MPRIVSLNTKIEQINALRGTKDISEWEDKFIESVYAYSEQGKRVASITDKQRAVIERLWGKHFA